MTQLLAILTRHGSLQREIPDPDQFLMTGLRWGHADEFPSPAYWLQQTLTHRLDYPTPLHPSGRTLAEEVAATLLAGQGVTAAVAEAAFERLRVAGALARNTLTEADYAALLSEPLPMPGHSVVYRLASQKAKYLAAIIPALLTTPPKLQGRDLRDWLMTLPGLGPKTATAIVRNWSGNAEVALLDSHVLRLGQVMGLFGRKQTAERHYLELEARFLQLCKVMDVAAIELETVINRTLTGSPETARFLADYLKATDTKPAPARRSLVPEQLSLVFTA